MSGWFRSVSHRELRASGRAAHRAQRGGGELRLDRSLPVAPGTHRLLRGSSSSPRDAGTDILRLKKKTLSIDAISVYHLVPWQICSNVSPREPDVLRV